MHGQGQWPPMAPWLFAVSPQMATANPSPEAKAQSTLPRPAPLPSLTPFAFPPEMATYGALMPQVSWTPLPVPMPPPFSTPFAFPPESTTYAAVLMPQASTTPLPVPFAQAARPCNVVVRSVWASNLQEELRLIGMLVPWFPYAAMDTEYPGTVHRSEVPVYAIPGEKRYALMKANVDELHLIQFGLTLFDEAGRLPDLGTGGATHFVWEFNFREFDPRRHPHAPESVAMLRTKGMDFDRTLREGVDMADFAPQLCKLLRYGLGGAGLVTFSGEYDVAYMVKMLCPGTPLPCTLLEFLIFVKSVHKTFYDVKEMARNCPCDLRGGLELVAKKLNVPRVVGEAHQAGSDSLLTCHLFLKMRETYFDDDHKLKSVAGLVAGITSL